MYRGDWRGRASLRFTREPLRRRIQTPAHCSYVGFNNHHFFEKLRKVEGFSLSRETLRRLLRAAGIGSPRERRPPAHRQRRLRRAREGEVLLLDGSLHDWLEGRGPQLTLLGFQDDATDRILVPEFFPTEDARGYFRLLSSDPGGELKEEPIGLSQREREGLRVLHETEQGLRTQREAGQRVERSDRQVRRLLARVRAEEHRGVVHRLRHRASYQKIPVAVARRVLTRVR